MNRIGVHFEDVQEGDQAPDWSTEPLERQHFVRYAGASGDFNPLHYDDDFAKRVGFPSVIAQGMFSAGVLSHYLTDWLGTGTLRKLAVRFRDPVFPRNKLAFKATITRKYKEDDENRVDCDLAATTQEGNTVLSGTCTAALPSRG